MNPQGLPVVMMLMRFLHNLFTAAWIGGLISMTLVVMPGITKNLMVKEPKPVIAGIQKRLKPVAIVSMVGLAITGILLGRASGNVTAPISFATAYTTSLSIKHIVTVAMVIVALMRLSMLRKAEAIKQQSIEKPANMLVLLNTVLGIVVLFLSSRI